MEIKLVPTDCPVCGSRNSKELFKDRNRREGLDVSSAYHRCLDCSAVYLNPTLDASAFSSFDKIFTSDSAKAPSSIVRILGGIHNNTIHGLLHKEPIGSGRGKRILDVGCSSGEKLIDFKRRGYEVFGVDLAPEAVARANERFGIGFLVSAIENAHFPDDFFDVVRADNMLEHAQNPVVTLRGIWRVLKPGGQLCIYVPNGDSLSVNLLKGASANSWIPFHVTLYTPKALALALSKAGFTETLTVTHTPPGLIIQTLAQAFGSNEKRNVDLGVFGFLLSLALLPATLVLSLLPKGEELVAFARKPTVSPG